jgi:hypothetical protein
MASRGEMGSVQGVLYPGGGGGARGFDLHRLGSGAVRSERRSELSAWVGLVWSGVRCVLRSSAGFRSGACVLVGGTACWAGYGARHATRRAGCMVPCTFMCRAPRERACVRGNARASHGMLGQCRARVGQGHSVPYGGSGQQGSIG